MKKIILFILLLADIPFLTETHASTKQQARDSIFQTAATIPNDSIRCIFLRNAFQQYIGQESATEYLDSAIVLARRKQIHGEELWALFDYCRQYEYLADIFNPPKRLLILKVARFPCIINSPFSLAVGLFSKACLYISMASSYRPAKS